MGPAVSCYCSCFFLSYFQKGEWRYCIFGWWFVPCFVVTVVVWLIFFVIWTTFSITFPLWRKLFLLQNTFWRATFTLAELPSHLKLSKPEKIVFADSFFSNVHYKTHVTTNGFDETSVKVENATIWAVKHEIRKLFLYWHWYISKIFIEDAPSIGKSELDKWMLNDRRARIVIQILLLD